MKQKILLGLVLGVLLFAIAAWGVPLDELGAAIRGIPPSVLAGVAVLYIAQVLIRSGRQMILVRSLAPESTYGRNLAILAMGFLCINLFPARLGEVIRPWLLKRLEGVPIGAGFGLFFVERIFDLSATLVMLQVVLLLVDLPSHELALAGGTIEVAELGQSIAAGVLAPVLIGVLALLVAGERVIAIARRIADALMARLGWSWLGRLIELVFGFADGFVDGLAVVRSPKRLALLFGLTASTWALSALMFQLPAASLGVDHVIGYFEGMGVMVLTMLGIMMPAPPGNAGVFEAAFRGALALFGVSGPGLDAPALAYALLLHWWTYAVQAALGLFFFQRYGIGLMEVLAATRAPDSEGRILEPDQE